MVQFLESPQTVVGSPFAWPQLLGMWQAISDSSAAVSHPGADSGIPMARIELKFGNLLHNISGVHSHTSGVGIGTPVQQVGGVAEVSV